MEEIFVQIAAYRDPELLMTIRTAWERARFPNRIHFGVCLQDTEVEYDKLNKGIKDIPNVSIHWVGWRETKGLCWARKIAHKLNSGQKYEIQVDSHMRFTKNWDSRAISMLNSTNCDRPLLTHYCPNWKNESIKSRKKQYPMRLSPSRFGDPGNDMLYLAGCGDARTNPPTKHAFISCHFVFSDPRCPAL